jgi:hypothetical protein
MNTAKKRQSYSARGVNNGGAGRPPWTTPSPGKIINIDPDLSIRFLKTTVLPDFSGVSGATSLFG